MSSMPSLNALRAFEAAARHRSVTLASSELFVTHGAVSRQVKALEEALGVTLLAKTARGMEPTPEGQRLAEGLTSAFKLIQECVARVRPEPLTLSCSSSIMMGWIIPRIGQFHELHPQIELQFNLNFSRIDFVRDKIGMAIRSSIIEPPQDAVIRELGVEAIGPVCAPDYLEQAGIRQQTDLPAATLLASRTRPEAWRDWQGVAGLGGEALAAKTSFDHFYLLIQAAACGLGMAVVPRMLVMEQLSAGRLVAPFGFKPGPRRIVLWVARHLAGRPDAVALERWLTAEMRATSDALS
ncbi:LysR family transcriptional regulator [Rhizobium rhizosphaerae]|uniref:LysR family transcriptional regulator n=1 Tax=Xaviernesmea rhizosphaerae TaxID=1672749 RepID=A0ABX3P9L2_9HYPH|nr:LysR substrate-binding domain-containing protein [Xaviernesmea rhizosphaerae]OQP84277.1 LysR family transcriptional regulator [Xaviernesmea rhizosphaerae]